THEAEYGSVIRTHSPFFSRKSTPSLKNSFPATPHLLEGQVCLSVRSTTTQSFDSFFAIADGI
ncbi:hypothetical protein MLQ95_23910, partial [Escherichia coli]|nr:hypothetical protein [Escherichia coli]